MKDRMTISVPKDVAPKRSVLEPAELFLFPQFVFLKQADLPLEAPRGLLALVEEPPPGQVSILGEDPAIDLVNVGPAFLLAPFPESLNRSCHVLFPGRDVRDEVLADHASGVPAFLRSGSDSW